MDKFKVGDVVWTGVPHFFQESGHIGFTPKVGMVIKTEWDTCSEFYTIETDGDPIDRVESEIYPLFDTNDLGQLSLDYKLILEQNQELLSMCIAFTTTRWRIPFASAITGMLRNP